MMAHVVTSACIDVKDGACVQCCPVDCIYEGPRMLYIQPDECVNCGICVSACPVQAIYDIRDLPPGLKQYERINREFFDVTVSGLGSPQGADGVDTANMDHPDIGYISTG